ncbi:MAG: monovalent cation:proton antiporter-2 (CPA2) family protein [Neomegalonema sp.]|nr:monovalent cation:proton antiporter-2 (CPA2) family protein [Neomegalonema sp.]
MASAGDTGYLAAAAVYLGAAVVAVPLFKRLGLGSVLGYLAAGVVIGPHAVGLIADADDTLRIAEFGVVLLLFVIGLELKPARLWRLRQEIFGLGLAQVMITGGAIGALALASGMSATEGIVAGAGLALSSTAFAVQILREKGDFSAPYGDRSFAILLFQDLAIVPLLALVSLLAPPSDTGADPLWLAGLKAAGAVGGLFLIGHFALKPIFRLIAAARADEVFTAAALLVVVGSALAMDAVGLSMALGAFLAGVLLAETEFRHQLETDIEPFRGLLMGLFFIAIGMSMDLELVAEHIGLLIAGVVLLIALKMAILYLLARAFRSPVSDAVRIAATLCQGGEFGFVIFSVAMAQGVMGIANGSLLMAAVTLSMAATPFIVKLADKLAERWRESGEAQPVPMMEEAPEDARLRPIIIAGFGRMGQVVGRILRLRGYEVTLIDNSPERIRIGMSFGNEVYFGDARRLDTLASAGADQARAIFLCIDDRHGARLAIERIRERFPNLEIFVTTYDRFTYLELEAAGAHFVERETFEASVNLATRAIAHWEGEEGIEDLIDEFRRRDMQLLRLQSEYGAHGGIQKMRQKYSLEKDF